MDYGHKLTKNITLHIAKKLNITNLTKNYWNLCRKLRKGCDDSLWSHEWKKHGSCMEAQNNITENEFFNIAQMQLFESYKFLLDINCNTKDDNCIMGCFDLDYNTLDEC